MSNDQFKRLDPKIMAAKKQEGVITLFVYGLICLALLYCTVQWDWPMWIFVVAISLTIASAPFDIYFVPRWTYQRWRYCISETSIQIEKGIFFKRKILIPMGKIQHVDAKQGPILKKYGLSTVILSTAAGSHEIPGLAEETADSIRKEIERHVRLDDEQV